MNQFRFGFSWIGVIIFLLPMLINIVYFMFPPANEPAESGKVNKFVEMVEQATRALYFVAIVIIVSQKKIEFNSPFLFLAAFFLILYYIVWIRYFAGGRDVALMRKSFLFVPIPLAVFPVLYFLFAALWIHNYFAAFFMIIFGIAHNMVSHMSFKQWKACYR